jgi:hypothetical protein
MATSPKRSIVNFDQFWAETQKQPQQVVLRGKTYTLPAEVPAALVLGFLRMQERAYDGSFPLLESDLKPGGPVHALVNGLFGDGTLESWLTGDDGKPPIGFSELNSILSFLSNDYAPPTVTVVDKSGAEPEAVQRPLT